MKGNLFLKNAKSLKKYEKNPQHDYAADIRFNIDKNINEYFLNINLNKDWSGNKKRSVVDTKILGKTKITKQFFEDRNGEKITINNDYHGKLRNQNNPMPGPFSFKESLDKLKVWPK